jgi:serine/threonine-protein kinase
VLVVGRYALFDEIGAGGMAVVRLGRALGAAGFARTVAIKQLHEALARDAEIAATLVDEARLTGAIHHPNVVSTLDVVSADDGLLIVMEYIHGETLARLAAAGRVPVGVAAAIVAGVLHGLHAAHEATDAKGTPRGVVHRDVSPQNILVGVDGIARIADFGVAKALGRIQVTREGENKGKLAYMAPEQIEGKDVDRRADIFAASIVLWEALVGERLFAGATAAETSGRVMTLEVEAPSRRRDDLPAELDAVVLRGLARDRTARFETAREMAIAIEEAVELPRAHEIGEWVADVASEALAARTEKLSRLDEVSSIDGRGARSAERPEKPLGGLGGRSPLSEGVSERPPEARAQRTRLAAIAALVAVAIIAIVAASRFTAKSSAEQTVPPSAETSATPIAATIASSIAPPPTPIASTSAAPRPPPRVHRPPLPRVDCDPPFTIDSTGIKVPKPACMHSP